MKKKDVWKIVCVIVAILCLVVVVIFAIINSTNKYDNKKFIENEIIEFESDTYKGIFCSMYPITNYAAKDFETYAGVKTYKSSVDTTNLKEISRYLDVALTEESQLTHVFIGLEPDEIWKSVKKKDSKWEENWKEYLLSYIEANEDITFQVMLPSPPMEYWLSLDNETVQETLAVYERTVTMLSSYSNVICYFLGAEEWLVMNSDNYMSEYETQAELTQKIFLYTFCDRHYIVNETNIKEKKDELAKLIHKEQVNPSSYADMSDIQVVFFGDSIIGNYKGTTSITGVMNAFAGCETYNYAIGGTSATDYEGYDKAFGDVLGSFKHGTAELSQGDKKFEHNEEKELCFVIHYGLNDFFNGYATDNVDNPYDTETYGGALRDGIRTLQSDYPDAKIIVVTPYCYYTPDEYEGDLGDYVDVAVLVAREMNVFCLNNYSGLGFNADNYREYLYDGCHPNEKGCMVMAVRLIRALEEEFGIVGNITPSQLISMEMVKHYQDIEDEVSIFAMAGVQGDNGEYGTESESEYANFAIADVDNYVNVRNQPSTDGEIVGKIFDGAVAQVLNKAGENDEWFQIVSGNVEGYIKAEFFIYGEEAAAVMDEYVTKYVEVKADRLNVRKEATTDSARIGYMDNGEKVKLIEDCGDWMKVLYVQGKEGYVSSEYVMVLEEYTYAKTLEEEQEEIAARKALEQRQKVSENLVPESTENVQPPNTSYATNAELRASIVNYALQYVGDKYVSGGTSLATGTDCSGFTCFVYADFGYSISRTPEGQYSGAGRAIDYSEIQPGDIICYSSNGGRSCTHVAMYIGDGQIVHAANSRKGVITSNADYEPIIGVRNVID